MSSSTLVNFPPKSDFKLKHSSREPGPSPAVVAHGPGKHRGLTDGKAESWPAERDHWITAKT